MTSNHKKFRLYQILLPLMTVGIIFEAQSGQLVSTFGSIGTTGVNRVLENLGFSGSGDGISDSNSADVRFLTTSSDEGNSANSQAGVGNNAGADGQVKKNGANGANVRNAHASAATTVVSGGSGGQGGGAPGTGGVAGSSGKGGDGGNTSAITQITSSGSRSIFVSAHAEGGSGGNSYGGNGGNGSKVASSIIVTADNSYISVSNTTTGGNGGDAYSGSSNGGRGGSASSSAIGNNIGAQSVYVFSTANGGAGGVAHGGGSNGAGGNAIAYASATSSGGYAYAYSTANGGHGLTVPSIINAHAVSNGGAGSQANAVATATGITVHAQTRVNNTSGTGDAIATVIQTATATSSAVGKEAATYGTALPHLADVSAALDGQPIVKHDFDLDGNSRIWLLGNMSVLNTSITPGLHDYHSMLNLNIDTTSISNSQHVLIGLLDPLFGNNSFLNGNGDSLTFSYSISGAGANTSKTYAFNSANANDAVNFFSDRTLDLGSLSGFVNSNNKYLNLVFNLDLQTNLTGAGLNLGLIAGNSSLGSESVAAVPLPGSFWLLGSAIAGMGIINRRRNRHEHFS